MLSMASWADIYTDGIAKRVEAGQITITVADAPILQDFFERTPEQMKNGVIEYIASLFRKNMTEKEFNDWMKYKPTKQDIAYDDSVDNMVATVQKPLDYMPNLTGISIALASGQEPEHVTPKSCSPSYKAAFDKFIESNIFNSVLQLQQWKSQLDQAGQNPESQNNIEYLVNKRAYPICYDNYMAALLNTCIDNYSEQQLIKYSKTNEMPFSNAIQAIGMESSSNLENLIVAAYGLPRSQWEDRMNQKGESLIKKYGSLDSFNFNVNFNGIKKFYK